MKNFTITLLLVAVVGTIGFAQLDPVILGSSSNAYSTLRPTQNQVAVDNESKTVVFVHRQDTSVNAVPASESGRLQLDVSIDGGASFSTNLGPLNSSYDFPARYPQVVLSNPAGSTDPSDLDLFWTAPYIDAGWDGHIAGRASIMTDTAISSEDYFLHQEVSTIPGSLTEGLPGEFWMVDLGVNAAGNATNDTILVYKGGLLQDTDTVAWGIADTITPNFDLQLAGYGIASDPQIAFSPDGMTAWIAFVGDLQGGPTFIFSPVLMKSTDGGQTWGDPVEVDVKNTDFFGMSPTITEELTKVWADTLGNPYGLGDPTGNMEFDLTVDANGNPHFFFVVGNATISSNPIPQYGMYFVLEKLAIDVTSDDQGANWKVLEISPVLNLTGEFGVEDPVTGFLEMDNYVQVARSEDGERIFYTWTDTDSSIVGFRGGSNEFPELRYASLRVEDGFMICPQWLTSGDELFGGGNLYPTLAPTVLEDGDVFNLPLVTSWLLTGNQLEPTLYLYWGNEAVVMEDQYMEFDTTEFTLDFKTCEYPDLGVGVDKEVTQIRTMDIFPNPARELITMNIPLTARVERLELMDLGGRLVKVATKIGGDKTMSLNGVNDGSYILRVYTNEGVYTSPLVVK